MSLNLSQLSRVAQLARLDPGPEASAQLLAQLNDLFALVEKMQAVDTQGVEPLAHPLATLREVAAPLADDVVSEPSTREANQRSAPATERGLYLVPRVIE